jgi:hypothetical protein
VVAACTGSDDTAVAPTTPPATAAVTAVSETATTVSATTVVGAATTSSTSTTAPLKTGPEAKLGTTLDAGEFTAVFTQAVQCILDGTGDVDGCGVELQLLFRALSDQPDLDEQVLAGLPDDVRPSVERVVRARQFAQARSAANPNPPEPPTTLPAWTIAEPEPADVLLGHYAEAEALTGVPWYWLAAIHLQETRMGRIVGVSSAGAVGPMQFLPTTWAECCTGDPLVTRDAILGAATYLAQSGAPDDMAAAVDQYNPNATYVALVTAYAENLRDQPELYAGYHSWQVFYGTAAGTVRLPVGYSSTEPLDAAAYLAANPADSAS